MVLIVEDDKVLSKNIHTALSAESIPSETVFDGALAERMLRQNNYDCVILDVNLPGKNGFDLCREFRAYNKETPVLMLTAFSELEDKVQGFDSGADDYLTKPFYMRELILRVNSLIKRSGYSTSDEGTKNLTADDLVITPSTREVSRQGQSISLTPREYQILKKLVENKSEIVSKDDLIKEIWGSSFATTTNTIEVYINFLRNKIDKPFGKNSIRTKVGYGYYFES